MVSKTGSPIRVLREEALPPESMETLGLDQGEIMEHREPSPMAVQSLPGRERPLSPSEERASQPYPGIAAAEKFRRQGLSGHLAELQGPHPTPTTITEAQSLQDLGRAFRLLLGVSLTISLVLAVRLMLLIAVMIAGALAWKTLENPTLIALSINGAFNLGVVVPIVALYWRRG